MKHFPRAAALAALIVSASALHAQSAADWTVLERARTFDAKPTTTAISELDLKSRLFRFADDSMRGRELGSPESVKGTAWIASELKRLGLEPAGENGGYLQRVPVVERALDEKSHLVVGGRSFDAWKDWVLRDNPAGKMRSIDNVPVVYGGVWGDKDNLMSRDAVAGKVVVVTSKPDEMGSGMRGLPMRGQVFAYFFKATAILVVGREVIPESNMASYHESSIVLQGSDAPFVPAYFYITTEIARTIFGADPATLKAGADGKVIAGNPSIGETPVKEPAYNVVGILRGSDPTLKSEYVAIGAHNDHIDHIATPASPGLPHDSIYVINHLFRAQGADNPDPKLTAADYAKVNAILADVRRKTKGASARLDSIYNGADDDGSGSVSVLEIAEWFAGQKVKPKRSMLFIWHIGEEEGLFGSEYFTDHPTVPRESIVTELNMDMVGRGDAGDATGTTKDGKVIYGNANYVQLVGSRRLSTELGDLVEKVNKDKKHNMVLDYSLDADGHPQNIYCRSDHYSYARYGIPITFFTTGGHADYHQLTDEPQYIDYAKMAKVANFVRDIAVEVANGKRPTVDKPKPDPHGACQQ